VTPRVCQPPEPDCLLSEKRIAYQGGDEALRRAILADQRRARPSLGDLIQAEATAQVQQQPLLLPKPEPVPPMPTNHLLKGHLS
jgi:hypothetical protein